jgi:hypothetical protein
MRQRRLPTLIHGHKCGLSIAQLQPSVHATAAELGGRFKPKPGFAKGSLQPRAWRREPGHAATSTNITATTGYTPSFPWIWTLASAKPVENMLVFAYELIRGTASDGKASGDNLYPAPTLQASTARR